MILASLIILLNCVCIVFNQLQQPLPKDQREGEREEEEGEGDGVGVKTKIAKARGKVGGNRAAFGGSSLVALA